MRAAAELGADALLLAKGDDAHFVAVLLGKERGHTLADGLVVGCPARVDRIVLQDDGIGKALDLRHILVAQRLAVGEVEAQALGRDQRAGLMHVRAQAIAQRGVQHVRARVVAHDVPAPVGVDGRLGRVTDLDGACRHRAHMQDHAGDWAAHIGHLNRPDRLVQVFGPVVDLAGVAHLAAGLDVKDRFGQ